MTHRDPSAELRRANPVREADMPSADSPKARALMERIVRTDPEPAGAELARRRARRRTVLVLVPIAIVALGAAGFSIYRSASEPLVIACHATMARQGAIAMAAGPGDPVGACTSLWRPGGGLNPRGELSIPLLEACILNGAEHVFPHPQRVDACDTLGLKHASPRSRQEADEAAAAGRVSNVLASEFLSACDTKDQAIAFANHTLKVEGLSGWTVKTVDRPFTDATPCAGAGVDVEHRTISIAPISRPPSP